MRPYSKSQVILHWVVALLVAAQILFHDSIKEAWHAFRKGQVVAFDPLVAAHVFGGIAILLLVLWRIAIRTRQGTVAPVAGTSPRMAQLTHLGHLALYAALALAALSGLATWFGGVAIAAEVHEWMEPAILILVGGHTAAALYHQFWLKDGLLRRMSLGG
ncbi:cytochrome b [Pseudorhodobacter sp.]|uniref:cytochrome b n=1 Tax=Pseudorhodobacter sp. TaxID=1934400 RepID=UPI002649694E|nr:cytochrome b/b6 domain-containing protein [Pseudorhodobacter sp.]MDN5786274.1 cytochrome b/b6 domain-containing protein [Pseudorhodobacter sp.]